MHVTLYSIYSILIAIILNKQEYIKYESYLHFQNSLN